MSDNCNHNVSNQNVSNHNNNIANLLLECWQSNFTIGMFHIIIVMTMCKFTVIIIMLKIIESDNFNLNVRSDDYNLNVSNHNNNIRMFVI